MNGSNPLRVRPEKSLKNDHTHHLLHRHLPAHHPLRAAARHPQELAGDRGGSGAHLALWNDTAQIAHTPPTAAITFYDPRLGAVATYYQERQVGQVGGCNPAGEGARNKEIIEQV